MITVQFSYSLSALPRNSPTPSESDQPSVLDIAQCRVCADTVDRPQMARNQECVDRVEHVRTIEDATTEELVAKMKQIGERIGIHIIESDRGPGADVSVRALARGARKTHRATEATP